MQAAGPAFLGETSPLEAPPAVVDDKPLVASAVPPGLAESLPPKPPPAALLAHCSGELIPERVGLPFG